MKSRIAKGRSKDTSLGLIGKRLIAFKFMGYLVVIPFNISNMTTTLFTQPVIIILLLFPNIVT